ncbi:hypothetical protein QLX08_010127 [Tetragonisca angustula]|uniref:Uncharacterized protein n=1 Tax=Tetragonisca angustula TaxID=166442 RepID=A0AAW0ZEP0_9HYME
MEKGLWAAVGVGRSTERNYGSREETMAAARGGCRGGEVVGGQGITLHSNLGYLGWVDGWMLTGVGKTRQRLVLLQPGEHRLECLQRG